MRKWISLFLLVWLPCFLMAAQATALQMQAASLTHLIKTAEHAPQAQEVMADMADMPCHQAQMEANQPPVDTAPPPPAPCKTCGFCLVLSHLVAMDITLVLPTVQSESTPRFYADRFSSRLTPPAIKPPIRA